jgi:tetratricopeptide (TPR) repeat protein
VANRDNAAIHEQKGKSMNFDQWRYYLRGLLLEMLKRPEPAMAAYRQALKAAPDFAQAASCLGYLHSVRNEIDEAEDYYLMALRLKPNADIWFNLGFIRDKHGRKEHAIEAFREAVRLKPSLDRAWYGMGLAYGALGQHDAATEALEKATALQPMNGHAWYALGMAHHHAHRPDKVEEVVRHMLRFDPVMTRQLIQEAERSDLAHLVKDLQL